MNNISINWELVTVKQLAGLGEAIVDGDKKEVRI